MNAFFHADSHFTVRKDCLKRLFLLQSLYLFALLLQVARQFALGAVCLLVFVGPHVRADDLDSYEVPFTYDPLTQPWIVVRLSLNGQPPMPFVLDTGWSEALSLDTQAASQLKLTPGNRIIEVRGQTFREYGVTSAELTDSFDASVVPFAGLKTVSVGDLSLLQRFTRGERIAGILGVTALVNTTTRIDFAKKMLTIGVVKHPPLTAPVNGTSLPMTFKANGLFAVRADVGPNAGVDLELDTGATNTHLPLALASALKPLGSRSVVSATLNRLQVASMLLLPSIKLGAFDEPNVAAVCAADALDVNVLGLDMLRRFVVTFDFPNRQLLLERPADYANRLGADGWTGISLRGQNGQFVVESVLSNSPGSKADVQAGDRIVRIDGRSAAGLPLPGVENLLRGQAQTQAELAVERNGKQMTLNVMRMRVFDAPPLLIAGLTLTKDRKFSLHIVQVTPDCPSARAGMKAGDVIVKWNGRVSADMGMEEITLEGRKAEHTFVVERRGQDKPFEVRLSASNPN